MVSDPSNNVNACEDFLELVVTAHVLAAFMTILGMKCLSDDPTSVLFPEGGTTEEILLVFCQLPKLSSMTTLTSSILRTRRKDHKRSLMASMNMQKRC